MLLLSCNEFDSNPKTKNKIQNKKKRAKQKKQNKI